MRAVLEKGLSRGDVGGPNGKDNSKSWGWSEAKRLRGRSRDHVPMSDERILGDSGFVKTSHA